MLVTYQNYTNVHGQKNNIYKVLGALEQISKSAY